MSTAGLPPFSRCTRKQSWGKPPSHRLTFQSELNTPVIETCNSFELQTLLTKEKLNGSHHQDLSSPLHRVKLHIQCLMPENKESSMAASYRARRILSKNCFEAGQNFVCMGDRNAASG